MKKKISQLFNAWFVFSFTSREDNQQLLRNTKNKPNYMYHKSSWSKSSAWTLANQRGEEKDRNIITGFKQLPNMQSSFKIDTFIPILIRSLVKCKHNKRCWPTDFFYWCIILTSSPSFTFFLCYFSFIFRQCVHAAAFESHDRDRRESRAYDSALSFPKFLQLEIVIIHSGPKNFLIFRGHFEGMPHV